MSMPFEYPVKKPERQGIPVPGIPVGYPTTPNPPPVRLPGHV
jgi:hypothetical protein